MSSCVCFDGSTEWMKVTSCLDGGGGRINWIPVLMEPVVTALWAWCGAFGTLDDEWESMRSRDAARVPE